MAQSRASKRFMNMSYGFGASIVIIGALFKITHFEIGILTGNVMLSIGLITEAIVFAISAFEPIY
jgi:gliding motility-associated protein GldL